MTELKGATVVVTGAGGGFGQHLTAQLLDAGSRVILSDRGDRVDAISDSYGGRPAVVGIFGADLATSEGCDSLYDAVRDLGASPDVLINNAGIAVLGRPDLVPEDRIQELMRINLIAPMRLCKLFLPGMIERQRGHLVNISSVAGRIGAPGLATYCASKFGLRGFGEALAAEVAEHNIHVSTVYPWFSRTPILDSEQFGLDGKKTIPDDIVTEPADVVAEILRGVRSNRTEIFPDKMSRRIRFTRRFFPWLIPVMQKRLQERTG